MQYLRIPEDRVAVLIGTHGEVKKRIEKETNTKITIEDGNVSIDGEDIGLLTARDIALAIGRGFSPEIAFRLLNEDNVLEIMPLMDFLRSERELARKKGRIIGRKGKTRAFIEGITHTNISVYGKSVGVIGGYDNVQVAKEAIIRLIKGARHSVVYQFLEKSSRHQDDLLKYEGLLEE
ncbi:MAG: RNA-processing protein [Candidatus Altiarchaeota archaeon]|nr:RNA-processing protein [Candidatus Altiarchaeota archaeon]